MVEAGSAPSTGVSAAELLALLGFGCFFGYLLLTFFWLLGGIAPSLPEGEAALGELFLFGGMALGYVGLARAGRRPSFNAFSSGVLTTQILLAAALPVAVSLFRCGVPVPSQVLDVLGLLAGLAAALFAVQWLDVAGRMGMTTAVRFTGLSLVGGCLLMAVGAALPGELQPLMGLTLAAVSLGLMLFSSSRAEGNDERAPLESVDDSWQFTREIEPTFLTLNIVFALTFALLFNNGASALFAGVMAAGGGALVAAGLYAAGIRLSVITMERVLLAVTVIACVATPLAPDGLQLVLSCLVTAAWGLFVPVNYSYIVMKSTAVRQAPTFRQAPARLAVPAAGLAVGWAAAALITLCFGAHSEVFVNLRTGMIVVLVIVFMAFFPSEEHHRPDGMAAKPGAPQVVSVSLGAEELFERRCDAVARLYQLSPRESDILRYLAKGRNASWIQEELTISPHTVKSHIYNIYRKLDIHSQQKVMDFVQSFPLQEEDL
ncbi:MAG: helix-turn-helix transcriptional regulator [Eggerthellaceae bacterium]|nr:helix-turn-helix transcriptional regulator [Eggerthellaceae bacterium]